LFFNENISFALYSSFNLLNKLSVPWIPFNTEKEKFKVFLVGRGGAFFGGAFFGVTVLGGAKLRLMQIVFIFQRIQVP